MPVRRCFVEHFPKTAIQPDQPVARGILRDTVQLLDHPRDDARGGFVLTALDERDEFVPGGILH